LKLYECDNGTVIVLDNVEFINGVNTERSKTGHIFYAFKVRFVSGEECLMKADSKKEVDEFRKDFLAELKKYNIDQSI